MLRNALGMCVVLGMAATAYAEVKERSLEVINQEIAKLEAKKKEIEKPINETQVRVNASFATLRSASEAVSKGNPSATVALTDQQRDLFVKANKDVAKLQTDVIPKLDQMKKEAGEINTELTRLKGEALQKRVAGAATESVKAAQNIGNTVLEQNKVIDDNKLLNTKLRVADLRMGLMELDLKKNGIDSTLNDMERIYDKSLLGAYLQDKIGQLLNSQVVCSVQKRCMGTDPKMIDSQRIRNEIFPESEAVRGNYYEKVNKKPANPVQ
ncbi:hypothetical protein [Bdellovibrio sp. HCB2-146]|uniref:hypothetical protein n=1 Tax=Bdellovibrio sp. HCB2-146 TaxID=3394362 RepID=UPI0039BCCB5C